MDYYISVGDAVEALENYASLLNRDCPPTVDGIVEDIQTILTEDLTPANVAPVMSARWEIGKNGAYPTCPICGKQPVVASDFCPDCGSKMEV